LLENTANESFLRASFTERIPEEQLLMNPLHKGRSEATSPRVATRGLASPSATDHFRNEPLSDFSRDDVQQAMRAALAEVKGQLGKTYPLVIGGHEVTPAETVESLNPSHKR